MTDFMRAISFLLSVSVGALALPAFSRSPLAGDDAVAAVRGFLEKLKHHEIDLYTPIANGAPVKPDSPDAPGSPDDLGAPIRYYDRSAVDKAGALLDAAATSGATDSALVLMQAATFRPESDPYLERRRWRAEQPWLVRRLATDALVQCKDPGTDVFLTRVALTDRTPRDGALKREIAARVLARRGSTTSAGAIGKLLTDDAASVRASAARALGELGIGEMAPLLDPALKDSDPTVRLEALLALDRIASQDLVGIQKERLQKAARTALEDSHWTVRLAAAEELGKYRDRSSIPALIAALEREQPEKAGSRHRVRTVIRDSLGALTGQDLPSLRPEEWTAWWSSVSAEFELPPQTKPLAREQGARYFGISIDGDAVVFLLDVSGSMQQPVVGDDAGPSRLAVANREFDRCLQGLRKGTRFNVILFNETFIPFSKDLVVLDEKTAAAATEFVRNAAAGGGTDLLGALELAFGEDAGRVLTKQGKVFDIDTIVLLSDGVPSRGAVLVPEQILHEVDEGNRTHRVTIHTVDAGGVAKGFLAELSKRNRGESAALGTK